MGSAHPGRGAPGDHRFPRSSRIHRAQDIRHLLREGTRRKTSHLDVFFSSSPASRPRFGVIVPKHRHSIVERNRLKRRLREVARTEVLPRLRERAGEVDVVVRARREAYAASYRELRAELVEVTEALC